MTWTPTRASDLTPLQRKLVHTFVAKGDLRFILHPGQQRIHSSFYSNPRLVTVLNLARRFGKSTLMIILCLEKALRDPKSQIWYASPTYDMTSDMVVPTMNEILDFFPRELRPTKTKDKWTFRNGSVITTVGVERDNGDKLRGKASHLTILDEVALMKDLQNLVQQNAIPPLLTTKGRLVLVSTPPTTTAHPFNQVFIPKAIQDGSYFHAPWYDNPLLDPKWMEENVFPEYPGLEENTNFRREYLADHTVTDADRRIVPEYDPDQHRAWLRNYTPPETFKRWVGIDFGFYNHAAAVFGYTDWKRDKVVICGEVDVAKYTTKQFADAIKEMEAGVWPQPAYGFTIPKVTRIADSSDPGKIHEFITEGLITQGVYKTSQSQMISRLRDALTWRTIAGRDIGPQIIIDPDRCPILSNQLQTGIWNKNRSDYEHKRGDSHLDLLDALKYLSLQDSDFFKENPFAGQGQTSHIFAGYARQKAIR